MAEWQYDAGEDVDEDDEEGGSWSFGGRTAAVFLIDASAEMFQQASGGDEDPAFNRAIKCAYSTLLRKIISSDQDLISVVLFNTREKKKSYRFCEYIYFARLGASRCRSGSSVRGTVTNVR